MEHYSQNTVNSLRLFVTYLGNFPNSQQKFSQYRHYSTVWTTEVRFPTVAMMGFFLFITASRLILGTIHVPIQWIIGGSFPGSKAAGA
jgi:hypothetical protein